MDDTLALYPATVEEIIERKDAALKALAMLDVLQEQKRLANAEYQMQIKAQKHELQANMDWLKSKGIFELELELQGGVEGSARSGHNSISGMKRDREKLNIASSLHIFTVQVSYTELIAPETINYIKKILKLC